MIVSRQQLMILLLAVEQGYKACENGKCLEETLQLVKDIYKVKEE